MPSTQQPTTGSPPSSPSPPTTPPVNNAPDLSIDSAAISAFEHRYELGEISVSDADGDPVQLALSGTDAGSFAISGEKLIAAVALDFEAPGDSDTDNVYEFSIDASDGVDAVSVPVTVTVRDVASDGVYRVAGAPTDALGQGAVASPDLNAGGEEDVLVSKYFRPYPGSTLESVAYILYREAFVSELPTHFDIVDLTAAEGVVILDNIPGAASRNQSASPFRGTAPGLSPGATADYVAMSVEGGRFAIFPDEVNVPLPETLDVFGPPVGGLRNRSAQSSPTPIGDFNGDGVTDAVFFNVSTPALIDGSTVRDIPGRYFDVAGSLAVQASDISFSGFLDFLLPFTTSPYTNDFNGDGLSDFLFLEYIDPDASQGLAYNIISGDVFDLSASQTISAATLANPDRYRVQINGEGMLNTASADVDGDGLADLAMFDAERSTEVNSGPEFGAIIISGDYITSPGDKEFVFDDLPLDNIIAFEVDDGSFVSVGLTLIPSIMEDAGFDVVVRVGEEFENDVRSRVYIVPASALADAWGTVLDLDDAPPPGVVTIFGPVGNPDTHTFGIGFGEVVPVGDGDGDGIKDLVFTVANYDPVENGGVGGVFQQTGAVYFVPSGLLREAAADNASINLDLMFRE